MKDIPLLDINSRRSIKDMFCFEGKVALVTGAAGQIGMMSAAGFAELGANVVVADVKHFQERLEKLADDLTNQFGHECFAVTFDAADENSVEKMLSEIVRKFGTIHVAHSNVGIGMPEDQGDYDRNVWDKIMDTNARGTMILDCALAKIMKKNKNGGAIVNTASMSASIINRRPEGCNYEVIYPASKACVKHLTRGLAMQYMKDGVRINSVSPGYVYSAAHFEKTSKDIAFNIETTPLKRYATAEEMTGAVLYLCSDLASYTTGADICVDGGYTIW